MLSTLANPDPTMTLPIILGILTMANVESSTWFMTAAERERVQKIQEMNEKKHAELGKGASIIRPQKIIKTTLRFLSVARIIVAAVTPGVSLPLKTPTQDFLTLFRVFNCTGLVLQLSAWPKPG